MSDVGKSAATGKPHYFGRLYEDAPLCVFCGEARGHVWHLPWLSMARRQRLEALAERLSGLAKDQWVASIAEVEDVTIEECRARFFLIYADMQFVARRFRMNPDSVEVLLELARADREDDFRFYALSQGISVGDLDALWEGTRRRLAT